MSTQIYEYQCSDCSEVFNDSFDFEEHMYEKHGELVFDYELGCYMLNEPDLTDGKAHRRKGYSVYNLEFSL